MERTQGFETFDFQMGIITQDNVRIFLHFYQFEKAIAAQPEAGVIGLFKLMTRIFHGPARRIA